MCTNNWRRRLARLERARVRAYAEQNWCRMYAVSKAKARLSFGGIA